MVFNKVNGPYKEENLFFQIQANMADGKNF